MTDVDSGNSGLTTRKKCLIGCGGCLVVLVLVVAGLMALGSLGLNLMKQTSDKTVQESLGKSYRAPAGYTVIGLPWGQKDLKSVVLLVDPQRGTTLMVIETQVPNDANQILKNGSPQQVESFIQQVSNQAAKGPGQNKTNVDVSNLKLDKIQHATLNNGKAVTLCQAKIYDKDKSTDSPAVIALLPESNNHLAVVMGLDPRNTSTDPKAHFTVAYQNLKQEVLKLINESELDARLQ